MNSYNNKSLFQHFNIALCSLLRIDSVPIKKLFNCTFFHVFMTLYG